MVLDRLFQELRHMDAAEDANGKLRALEKLVTEALTYVSADSATADDLLTTVESVANAREMKAAIQASSDENLAAHQLSQMTNNLLLEVVGKIKDSPAQNRALINMMTQNENLKTIALTNPMSPLMLLSVLVGNLPEQERKTLLEEFEQEGHFMSDLVAAEDTGFSVYFFLAFAADMNDDDVVERMTASPLFQIASRNDKFSDQLREKKPPLLKAIKGAPREMQPV